MKKQMKAPARKKTIVLPKTEKDSKGKAIKDSWDPRPSITITEAQIADIKNWKIKESKELSIVIEVTNIRVSDYGENKGKTEISAKIAEIKV